MGPCVFTSNFGCAGIELKSTGIRWCDTYSSKMSRCNAGELWIPENEEKYRDAQRTPADLDFDE